MGASSQRNSPTSLFSSHCDEGLAGALTRVTVEDEACRSPWWATDSKCPNSMKHAPPYASGGAWCAIIASTGSCESCGKGVQQEKKSEDKSSSRAKRKCERRCEEKGEVQKLSLRNRISEKSMYKGTKISAPKLHSLTRQESN